jgi:hypothetical protein
LSLARGLRAGLLLLAGAATLHALGPPRFTWANAGLQVAHPATQAVAALFGAALLLLALRGVRPRPWALLGAAAALGLVILGGERLAYRVETLDVGLRSRTLFGPTTMTWAEIARVESQPSAIVVHGRDGSTLAVATGSFPPAERTRLERTIARRVREASAP